MTRQLPVESARLHALGSNIRAARTARKLRLIDVANRTRISLPKLCRIELGQHGVSLSDLRAIAEAIGCSTFGLLPKGVRIVQVPKLVFGGRA